MVCDWIGAGKAIHGKNEVYQWYYNNCQNMILHPETRKKIEMLINRYQ
jgi:hypothetical protein